MSAAAWRMFLICGDAATCTHPGHTRGAKARYRQAMAAPTLLAAARVYHYGCDMWAQGAHSPEYLALAERHCGPDALRHIVHLANRPELMALYFRE